MEYIYHGVHLCLTKCASSIFIFDIFYIACCDHFTFYICSRTIAARQLMLFVDCNRLKIKLIVLYCIASHCIVLYCIVVVVVLYCIVLYCIVSISIRCRQDDATGRILMGYIAVRDCNTKDHGKPARAPSQYKHRLSQVWGFPC